MTWFKTDDGFWRHRKLRRIPNTPVTVSMRVAAAGAWLLCGTWSAGDLSDGFVPAEVVQGWDPTEHVAQRLVAAGLWDEAERDGERGYQYHDWADYQPTREEVLADRAAARDRMQRLRHGRSGEHTANVPRNNGGTSAEPAESPGRSVSFGTRSPERSRERSPARSGEVRDPRPVPSRPDPSSSSSHSSTPFSTIATTLGLNPDDDEEEIKKIYELINRECKPTAPARYIRVLADNGDLPTYQARIRRDAEQEPRTYKGPTHTFETNGLDREPRCIHNDCNFPESHAIHRVTTGAAV